ncbi:MAG: NAD(P)-dependent oxidoreductase [Pseudolabrys sp.]
MDESRKPSEAPAEKMGPLARLPVFLALEGKRCVLVGDGQAVDWKLELLEAAGAQVQRYAADRWTAEDLRGAAIAVGGFDNDESAAAFAVAAGAAGVPVNVIDRPAFCDFAFGAIVNRSPLVMASQPTAQRPCSRRRSAPSWSLAAERLCPLGRCGQALARGG